MTAGKVLSILNLYSMDRKVLTVEEMAKLLEMPKSSVYRFVRTLKEHGLLMEHSQGLYKLGFKFLDLANIVRSDLNIAEVARPIMDRLTSDYGETTILSVLSETNAVCLTTSTPNQTIRVSSEEGKIMPLYCGASSKSILAFQDVSLLDRIIESGQIKRYTDRTLTRREEILENMKLIQEQGYAYSHSELDKGIVSYGFPIRNAKGQVFASLAIVGTEQRMGEKETASLIRRFKKEVAVIESFL